MDISLKPVKPKRVSDLAFDQLRELIFRGELQPGQQLMPERELAAALDVSRTTVRDAITKLVVMGLLEHRQGQGTFVLSLEADTKNPMALAMETQDATLVDMLEVRMGLECNAAWLAAQRASEQDINFLDKSTDEMHKAVTSGRLGTEADVSFHMAIAYATKNPVQIYLMKNLYDFLFVGIKENLSHLYTEKGNIEKILAQHEKIYGAIRNHDREAAYQAMQVHISFVLNFFKTRV